MRCESAKLVHIRREGSHVRTITGERPRSRKCFGSSF
jgi:hypothetical protein